MLLLTGAKIRGAQVEAIAVENGRIAAVGAPEDLRSRARGDVREIDVGGRRVVPGLIDGHAHVLRAGITWDREVHWDRVASLEEAIGLLRERAEQLAPGSWVPVIGGWHPGQFREGRGPTREELDAALPDHPCYVQLLYDEAVLNSAALQAAGITAAAGDPPGGEIDRDADGRPTGVIRGIGAFRQCLTAMGMPTLDAQLASFRSMLRSLAAYGLTGALDPGGIGVTPETYEPIYELWRRGELSLRTRLFLGAGQPGNERRDLADWMRFMPRDFGDDVLRITGIGEIIVFGCWDRDGLTPLEMDAADLDEFREISAMAAAGGWPMHVHAIRDSSASAILDCWEQVAERYPIRPLRFSFTHGETITEGTMQRAKALGVGIALQHRMLYNAKISTRAWGEAVGSNAPPMRRLMELGFPLSAGTDASVVASADPWLTLWWFVTGQTIDGGPRRRPDNLPTRAQALQWYTRGSAWFSSEESTRGELAPGFLADIAVLSDDYFDVPPDEIPGIRSELTLVGGRVVHAANSFAGATALAGVAGTGLEG